MNPPVTHAMQERRFRLMPNGGGYVAFGVAPRIDDCCALRDRDILMRVEITDRTGATGSDERQVHTAAHCLSSTGAGCRAPRPSYSSGDRRRGHPRPRR